MVDRKSRFMWIFISVRKALPAQVARIVLQKFKFSHKHKTIRMDQGGELGKSQEMLDILAVEGLHVVSTGSDATTQNGLSGRPNRTLGEMM